MAEMLSGLVQVRDSLGHVTVGLDGDNGDVRVGGGGKDGNLVVCNAAGQQVLWGRSQQGELMLGPELPGDPRIRLHAAEGDIVVLRRIGGVLREAMRFDASHAALYMGSEDNEGDIIVRDNAGKERIRLDGASGDIKLFGADVAEEIDVTGDPEPGSVLVIGDDGCLRLCDQFYNRRVAGVVSGAGNLQAGVVLGHGASGVGRPRLALAGRVKCLADGSDQAIDVGDLLTTSARSGYAMKATDADRAFGAVIGKAMRSTTDIGLVPTLVSLH